MHDLVTQHQALDARARRHKRESARHRTAARDCRQRQREIEAACERLGITVTHVPHVTHIRGENHHGGSERSHPPSRS